MGAEHPQIASAALGVLDVLLDHYLYDDLMDPSRGFIRQFINLLSGSDLGLQKKAIRTVAALSTAGLHTAA